jgi:SpoVK/Ycf46/Vps4 family AAA+-type ATPase
VSDTRPDLAEDFVTLARLALGEKPQDVQLFLGRLARKYREGVPEVADQVSALLKSASNRSSALRREAGIPVPVDADSRLHLLRIEPPTPLAQVPVLAKEIEAQISGLIRERQRLERLTAAGLQPSRSALFVGPPGVGKTLSARWIASQLGVPLLILDLSAVMSSFLGRTGNNVRAVLDYAKRQSCVLLLDELDAIAKRRDDATEVGELKRLVTVLLQEIDEWPGTGMLIAATNHPELLDPAVWRRFDLVVNFPKPAREDVAKAIKAFFGEEEAITDHWIDTLSVVLGNSSYSDIEKRIVAVRRAAALDELPLDKEVEKFIAERVGDMTHSDKQEVAVKLASTPNISVRAASDMTGVHRDTISKRLKELGAGHA